MSKNFRYKFAAIMVCASVLSSKTSAMNTDKNQVKIPQTLGSVRGATFEYQSKKINLEKVALAAVGSIVVLEAVRNIIGGFTKHKIGSYTLGRLMSNSINKDKENGKSKNAKKIRDYINTNINCEGKDSMLEQFVRLTNMLNSCADKKDMYRFAIFFDINKGSKSPIYHGYCDEDEEQCGGLQTLFDIFNDKYDLNISHRLELKTSNYGCNRAIIILKACSTANEFEIILNEKHFSAFANQKVQNRLCYRWKNGNEDDRYHIELKI